MTEVMVTSAVELVNRDEVGFYVFAVYLLHIGGGMGGAVKKY